MKIIINTFLLWNKIILLPLSPFISEGGSVTNNLSGVLPLFYCMGYDLETWPMQEALHQNIELLNVLVQHISIYLQYQWQQLHRNERSCLRDINSKHLLVT